MDSPRAFTLCPKQAEILYQLKKNKGSSQKEKDIAQWELVQCLGTKVCPTELAGTDMKAFVDCIEKKALHQKVPGLYESLSE